MKNKYPGPEVTRFESQNAEALAEAREEQRRLRAKRKSGVPMPSALAIADRGKGTHIIYCRRGTRV